MLDCQAVRGKLFKMTKWEKIKSDPIRHAAYKARELARVNRDRAAYNAKKQAWMEATKDRYLARKRQQYANKPEVYRAKCRRQRNRWTPEEKDRRRLAHRAWCVANRDKRRASINKCNRKRSMEDRDRYSQYRRAKYKKRRAIGNPAWLLKARMQSGIAYLLSRARRGKAVKSARTMELLGCSFSELKCRIEAWFRPGMSWSNWGSAWEIDHIQPVSTFDLRAPDQQRQCFHYSNLQPLFVDENSRKRNYVPEFII